jgi:predicted metal-dependent HD superfamily phosphohydrolase
MANAAPPDPPSTLLLPAGVTQSLAQRYAEPHRHYHALPHVQALLCGLAAHRHRCQQPDVVTAAIWFHDAIYDTRRQDNEQASAELARSELGAIGWPAWAIERVAALVLATQHHQADDADADAWLLLDLDLSVLGQTPARYEAYSRAIRAEYGWVDEASYRQGRRQVLAAFLTREALYRTPALHAAWEAQARINLQHEWTLLAPN